jgi:hypothetical protein
MKKILLTFYIFIILNSFMFINSNPVYAFDAEISNQAINAPLTLPVWYPPWYVFPVETVKHLNILKSIIAPALTGTDLLTGAGLLAKPQQKATNSNANFSMMPPNNNINNFGNEEILYNIDFKNSPETPVYHDTIIFIKIPDWLKYSEGSLKLNNQKLTDKKDKDRLVFLPEDGILKISLKNINLKQKITVTFGAKAISANNSENIPYCLIKFQSKSAKNEMEWQPFSRQ